MVIKKLKIEIFVLCVLLLNIFISHNIDIGFFNFFSKFDNSLKSIYLKDFFVQITILGDSFYYFFLSIIFFLIYYLFDKFRYFEKYKSINTNCKNFSIFLLVSLIVVGFFTQLLKFLVGRPRPNYTSFDGSFEFNFFSFASEYHSFPSGHSSTIFTLALVISFLFPKIRYFFLFLASIVAFSRVVVGAHFFTDILAGAALAFIGVKLVENNLKKYLPKKIAFAKLNISSNIYLVLVLFFFVAVFVGVGHSLDLYFSSLFYYGEGQFVLQNYYSITIFFRKIILPLILVYVFILPFVSLFLPIKNIYFNYGFKPKDIFFLWFAGFINLIIIINLGLKTLWGRARPGDVIQFEGKESFSPWFEISNACNTNCSFVSGDSSVGFSLVLLYFLTKSIYIFWLSLIAGTMLGVIRILEGGHFLSDVLLSGFLIFVLSYLQFIYYKKIVK